MGSVCSGGAYVPQALVPMTAVAHTVSKTLQLQCWDYYLIMKISVFFQQRCSDNIGGKQIILTNTLIILQKCHIILRVKAEALL